jgi:hypothetical protein
MLVDSKDINILFRWLRIRSENGFDMPSSCQHFEITCHKSALLNRMLEGKEPLEIPPPKSMSYPWYDLIENGISYPTEVWEATESWADQLADYPIIVIDQSLWKMLAKLDEENWLVTYSYGPEGDRKFAEGIWQVYTVGSSIPRDPENRSFNKLWEIKKVQ